LSDLLIHSYIIIISLVKAGLAEFFDYLIV
jgi:hypothetical protein